LAVRKVGRLTGAWPHQQGVYRRHWE